MESIYKVGDEVLVKSKLDDNYVPSDYPFGFLDFGFLDCMVHTYGGKIYKIKKVFPSTMFDHRKLYEEPYGYLLVGSVFRWSSAMFEKEF